MQLAVRGDPRARNLVAQRLCDRVRRIQRGLLASPSDADDAAQESLVEVLRCAGSYRGDSSLERWSDRVSVRTGLRFKRTKRRHQPDQSDPAAELSTVDDHRVHDALPRPLATYLGELKPPQRQAIFLKHALGYTVPEIAALTESTTSAVKFRLAKGLQQVRKAIRRDLTIGAKGGTA